MATTDFRISPSAGRGTQASTASQQHASASMPQANLGTASDFFKLSQLNSISPASILPKSPSIASPKGGGAISGMGEKFEVSSSTGSANFSIPIRVTPARSGLQPQLALAYDTAAGNSEFGLGWHLSGTRSITRKTSKGLPRYNDQSLDEGSDVFIFSGLDDLVPVFKQSSSSDGATGGSLDGALDEVVYESYRIRKYVPRITQDFSRIERWTSIEDKSDIHWRVISPDNHTSIYGRDANSRIFDPKDTPDGHARIFAWLQCETYDAYGNCMVFQYKAEDSDNIRANTANEANRSAVDRSANRYLKSIKYGNMVPNRNLDDWTVLQSSQLPSDAWMFTVLFDYGEHDIVSSSPIDEARGWLARLDPFSRYQAGFEIRTYRLCRGILLFHHFPELGSNPVLISSLDLGYKQDASTTYLRSAQQTGYYFEPLSVTRVPRSLPPLQFTYQEFPSDEDLVKITAEVVEETSLENLPVGLDAKIYKWVDLDGEGLPGILSTQDRAWYYKRNIGANNVKPPSQSSSKDTETSNQTSARLSNSIVLPATPSEAFDEYAHFGDIKGAGKLDLIVTAPSAWGYYERDTSSLSGWAPFRTLPKFPNINSISKNTKLIDLTGDGLPDVLIWDDQVITWYPSLGDAGYGDGVVIAQPNREDDGPVCLFQDTEQTLYLADMSGDGLMDLVRIRNSDICYWPNCGYGKFGSLVRMDNAPCFDNSNVFNERMIHLADIDGSGTTDIVYLSVNGVDIFMNQSGNSLSSRKRLPALFPIDESCVVNVIDLLGTGTSCIVWSSSLPSFSRSQLRYLDLNQGRKPHLLSSVSNNLGAETSIRYAPSTKFYLNDKQNGRNWITNLPFPVHCVESVEIYDSISHNKFTKRYAYHHGYFDGVEREFRGFACTDEWDTATFDMINGPQAANIDIGWHLSPVRTTTWYHTGVFFDGQSWSQSLASEYFSKSSTGDQISMHASGPLLPDSVLPNSVKTDILRECCRALKGRLLRREVYGEDVTTKSDIPYSIEEANYSVDAYQDIQDSHQHCSLSVFPRESISCHLDRTLGDPRLHHDLVIDHDEFGNVKKSIKIVYGRHTGVSTLEGEDKLKQEATYLLYMENDLTNGIDTAVDYRTPATYDSKVYQITGISPAKLQTLFSIEDFAGKDGSFSPLSTLEMIPFETETIPSKAQKRLIQESRVDFRKDDLSGLLPAGVLDTLAIPGETYNLCYTPGLLSKVYQRQRSGQAAEVLLPDPEAVLAGGQGETKFGYVDLNNDSSWWRRAGRVRFSTGLTSDPKLELSQARASFFQPRTFLDPLDHKTSVTYDRYNLLPVTVQNPVGSKMMSEIDYRVLKPRVVTDPNGNRVQTAFDGLGMVTGIAKMGKLGSNDGDSLDNFKADLSQDEIDQILSQPKGTKALSFLGTATTRIVYDYSKFQQSEMPAVSVKIDRLQHGTAFSPVQVEITYSDGFGRVVQQKKQAKSGPLVDNGPDVANRWMVNGWVVLNNKGSPVRQYEPFFDDTHDFRFNMKVGNAAILLYDPLSRHVATLRQDHTASKTIFNTWSNTISDANDNIKLSNAKLDSDIGFLMSDLPEHEYLPSWYDARITGQKGDLERAAAIKAVAHNETPRVVHMDSLGRVILQVDDNGTKGKISTRYNFDISGNLREVYDDQNRLVQVSDFNMCGDLIHEASMDDGEKWILPDVFGDTGLSWNSRGFRQRRVYDDARRLTQIWSTTETGSEAMIMHHIYGEDAEDAIEHNLNGFIYKTRDQAGEMTFKDYDFKGNLLASERKLAKDYKNVVDWSSATNLLEDETFQFSTKFDALDRHIQSTLPDSSQTSWVYNESGFVEQIFVNVRNEQNSPTPTSWTPIVNGMSHNASGQVTMLQYGNGTTVVRSYDDLLHRLTHIKTMGSTNSPPIQDLTYVFDAVGNITHVQDQAQQTIFFRNNRVDPSSDYTYDAMYRLISASGREHLGQTNGRPDEPTPSDASSSSTFTSPTDSGAMGAYTETYEYDSVGNISSLTHAITDPNFPGWKRSYTYNETNALQPPQKSNRLSQTNLGNISQVYKYDKHGNMVSMPHLNTMQWDFQDQLHATSKQIVNSGTPETTYYVYDSEGNRVRKVTESANTNGQSPSRMKERIYFDDFEIFRTFGPSAGDQPASERVSMFVEHSSTRIFEADTRTTASTDQLPARRLRFSLSNHLQSVAIILDETGKLVSYEEYFPFGGTAYQATPNQSEIPKRYRYSGKERDDDTGLYYYGARYYASWLGRWISPDPGGISDGLNLYQFAHNSPVTYRDPDGRLAFAAIGLGLAAAGEVAGGVLATAGAIVSSPVVIGVAAVAVVGYGAYKGYQYYRDTHPQEQPRIGPHTDVGIEPKSEPRIEPRAEPRVEPRVEPKVIPKSEPKTKPKEKEKEKEKEKDKTKPKTKTKKQDPENPQQHHIYPKQFHWFWKAIGIDVDKAENVIWVSMKFHLGFIHRLPYNTAWMKVIEQFVDWKTLKATGGKVLQFVDPITGNPMSKEAVGIFFKAFGQATKEAYIATGIALPSQVPYLGNWNHLREKYGTNPQSREQFWRKPENYFDN